MFLFIKRTFTNNMLQIPTLKHRFRCAIVGVYRYFKTYIFSVIFLDCARPVRGNFLYSTWIMYEISPQIQVFGISKRIGKQIWSCNVEHKLCIFHWLMEYYFTFREKYSIGLSENTIWILLILEQKCSILTCEMKLILNIIQRHRSPGVN
jgi:hypothetical protein